MINNLRINIF